MSDTPQFNPERDARGRFAKGNTGDPGNPHARVVAALRKEVTSFMAAGNLRPLVARLYKDALDGDNVAARLLLQYSIGRPAAAVDPDELEVHELDLFRRATATERDRAQMVGAPAGLWNQLTANLRPILAEIRAAEVRSAFDNDIEDGVGAELEKVSELLRHPTLSDFDRQAKERAGRRDTSGKDAHRGSATDGKRSGADRAANPPRRDGGTPDRH